MGIGASGDNLSKSKGSNFSTDSSGSRFSGVKQPEPDLVFTLNQ